MGTSTLHLNNPVPSNGAVAASLGGRHTVTATLSGVGAISCKVQAWASVDGTDSRMIGAPVVISGTTTVSQTLTFNALDVTQFWLAVVEITPACTFTATVENSGDVQFGGAVRAREAVFANVPQARKRSLASPSNHSMGSAVTYNPAYGFMSRFLCPISGCIGFDVVWHSGHTADATIGAARWSTAGSLTASAPQVSPKNLYVGGVSVDGLKIPAALSAPFQDGTLISDFVSVKIAPGEIVEIRTNMPLGGKTYSAGTPATAEELLYPNIWQADFTGSSTGDGITGNPAMAAFLISRQSVCYVRWYTAVGSVVSVCWVGDSTVKGHSGTTANVGLESPLYVAARKVPRISPYVYGVGGGDALTSHKAGKSLIDALTPDVIIIQSWSPNNGFNIPAVEACIHSALNLASYAISKGTMPIIATPWPWEGKTDGANYAAWRAAVDYCIASVDGRFVGLLDLSTLLELPGTGTLKPEYVGASSTVEVANHGNEACKIAIADEVIRTLSRCADLA